MPVAWACFDDLIWCISMNVGFQCVLELSWTCTTWSRSSFGWMLWALIAEALQWNWPNHQVARGQNVMNSVSLFYQPCCSPLLLLILCWMFSRGIEITWDGRHLGRPWFHIWWICLGRGPKCFTTWMVPGWCKVVRIPYHISHHIPQSQMSQLMSQRMSQQRILGLGNSLYSSWDVHGVVCMLPDSEAYIGMTCWKCFQVFSWAGKSLAFGQACSWPTLQGHGEQVWCCILQLSSRRSSHRICLCLFVGFLEA